MTKPEIDSVFPDLMKKILEHHLKMLDEIEERRRILEQDMKADYAEELYEQRHPHIVRDEHDL